MRIKEQETRLTLQEHDDDDDDDDTRRQAATELRLRPHGHQELIFLIQSPNS